MQDIQKKIGSRIRELRVKQHFSQESFADACGIHRAHMGEIERGKRDVAISTLLKVSRGLGISVSALLKGVV